MKCFIHWSHDTSSWALLDLPAELYSITALSVCPSMCNSIQQWGERGSVQALWPLQFMVHAILRYCPSALFESALLWPVDVEDWHQLWSIHVQQKRTGSGSIWSCSYSWSQCLVLASLSVNIFSSACCWASCAPQYSLESLHIYKWEFGPRWRSVQD